MSFIQKNTKLSGLCGIIGPTTAILMIFLAVNRAPWFSWTDNALSDLGVSEVAYLFNSAVIFAGVLNFVFAMGVNRVFGQDRLSKIGSLILVLGGTSLGLVGVFTEDTPVIHSLVAMGYFVLFPVALIILGYSLRNIDRKYGVFTILSGVLAFGGIFGLMGFYRGLAIPEIVEAVILALWTASMGYKLMTKPPT